MFLHYFIVLKNTGYKLKNVLKDIIYLLDYLSNFTRC
jgi:hypothetical protein